MRLVLVLAATAGLLMAHDTSAAEVKVLASPATKEACVELIPAFESSSGHTVVVTWTGTQNVRKQILSGEVYDLVIVARPDSGVGRGRRKSASGGHWCSGPTCPKSTATGATPCATSADSPRRWNVFRRAGRCGWWRSGWAGRPGIWSG